MKNNIQIFMFLLVVFLVLSCLSSNNEFSKQEVPEKINIANGKLVKVKQSERITGVLSIQRILILCSMVGLIKVPSHWLHTTTM